MNAPLTLVTTAPDPGTLRVDLHGDLDYATAGRFVDEVSEALTRMGLHTVRLNCANLQFCDSSGLSAFLAVHRRAGSAGLEFILEERRAQLDRLLDVTGTLTHLTGEPPVHG